jgi:microcystin-dependent protein
MVTLSEAQMPSHNHTMMASANPGDLQIPSNQRTLARTQPGFAWQTAAPNTDLASQALENTGGSQAHNNMQPFLTMNFIIALVGLYPSRS